MNKRPFLQNKYSYLRSVHYLCKEGGWVEGGGGQWVLKIFKQKKKIRSPEEHRPKYFLTK